MEGLGRIATCFGKQRSSERMYGEKSLSESAKMIEHEKTLTQAQDQFCAAYEPSGKMMVENTVRRRDREGNKS